MAMAASTTASPPPPGPRPRADPRARDGGLRAYAVEEDRYEGLGHLLGRVRVRVALPEDLPDDQVVDDHPDEGARREQRVDAAEGALADALLEVARDELAVAADARLLDGARHLVALERR